jgi:hypothetical protein
MSKIIIPGGVNDWWPSHRFDDFVVDDKHTVFEWCMIYTDRHPAVLRLDYDRATAECQDYRLILLGALGTNEATWRPHPTEADKGIWDDPAPYRISNEVYQDLAAAIRDRRIEVERRVYLDDRPDELDATLCIIEAAPVLAIARRRKGYGEAIARLLEAHEGQKDEQTAASTVDKAVTPSLLPLKVEIDQNGHEQWPDLEQWAREQWQDKTSGPCHIAGTREG